MKILNSCNYFDLFGFDSNLNSIARIDISICKDFYPEGFVFERGKKYSGFIISDFVNGMPLVYIVNNRHIQLQNFVPDGTIKEIFYNCNPEKKLYRYGKSEYNEKALKYGEFLIKPAITFAKAEHNQARQDNEHIFKSTIKKEQNITIEDAFGHVSRPVGDTLITTFDRDINKYLLCMSYDYDMELYKRFEADSCLIIRNTVEFEKRLMSAMEQNYPNMNGISNRVSYSTISYQLGVIFTKPFDFALQREYRFCWCGDSPIAVDYKSIEDIDERYIDSLVKPFLIQIGNLEDIAEICLPQLNNEGSI